MAIPLDIEDILGAGCLAALGRTLSALACLWLGAATGIHGVESGALAAEVFGTAVADRDYAIGDPSHVPRPPETSLSERDSPALKSSRDRAE